MADLDSKDATEATRIVGATSDGTETTPVRSTVSGELNVRDDNANTSLGSISASSAAMVQLKFAELRGDNIDNFMINDNGEIIYNDAGQLLQEIT